MSNHSIVHLAPKEAEGLAEEECKMLEYTNSIEKLMPVRPFNALFVVHD